MKALFIFLLTFLSFTSVFSQNGWIAQSSGVNYTLRAVCFINTNTGWAAGDSGKIVHTTNGGVNWILQNSNTTRPLSKIVFTDANNGMAEGDYYEYNPWCQRGVIGLSTSTGGATWVVRFAGPSSGYTTDLSAFGNNIYSSGAGTDIQCIGTIGGISMTTNNGMNWTPFYTNSNFSFSYFSICFINYLEGWAYGQYHSDFGFGRIQIIKTTNAGLNWQRTVYDSAFGIAPPYTLLRFVNSNTGYAIKDRRLVKSTDGGFSWLATDSNTLNLNYYHFIDPNTGWCIGSSGKIIRTTNGGTEWIYQNSTVTVNLNSVQFLDPYVGYVAGNNGVILKTITGGLTQIGQTISDPPDSFLLDQNFPNPFNPNTIINYTVRQNHYSETPIIKLVVYDISGKVAKIIVNERQQAGSYSVEFDGTNYSSGIYYYSLSANENLTGTKKMILIR
jgi:photosystem II stability/assembly factor-like uncharacterized protein